MKTTKGDYKLDEVLWDYKEVITAVLVFSVVWKMIEKGN